MPASPRSNTPPQAAANARIAALTSSVSDSEMTAHRGVSAADTHLNAAAEPPKGRTAR